MIWLRNHLARKKHFSRKYEIYSIKILKNRGLIIPDDEIRIAILETKDHNPKTLLTMDIDPETSYNGIKKINVLDWLIEKNL